MPTINFTAKGRDQELILAYLTENASDVLAEKINNGTPFEKDGKQLINRKDLNGFMKYACGEARKQAEKGSNSTCVEDAVVYGWAIHYFEEDSIEGKLYNPDGTEYKPPAPVKKATTSKTATKPTPPPKPKSQFSFFDLINDKKDGQPSAEDTEQESNIALRAVNNAELSTPKTAERPAPTPTVEQKPRNPLYEKYKTYTDRYPDSVIAIRIGDFYEVFGKRAVELADELNLTLTGRNLGLEQRIPMVGFPYHAAETYFKKIRQSHSVVVVEDNSERKLDTFDLEDILDGDNELTEAEMQLFDGDIQEPKYVPPAPPKERAKVAYEPVIPTDSDSPYDETALAKVVKLLGDCFILG